LLNDLSLNPGTGKTLFSTTTIMNFIC